MFAWLLKDGEHLPVQPGLRKMRMWMLADALMAQDHSVVWWASTFSHQRKSLLYRQHTDVTVRADFHLKLLYAGAYRRNISLRRYRHHGKLARRFRAAAWHTPRPDVIVTALPHIELAYEAVRYGHVHRIPTIIDVRDLWPDTFLEWSPRGLRPLVRLFLGTQFARARAAVSGATSIVAISQGCLDWALRYAGRTQGPLDAVYYTGYPDEPAPAVTPDPAAASVRERRAASAVIFTFIGTFGQSYELRLVCEVARRLAAEGAKDVHFALVGDGEQMPSIRRATSGMPNVSLLGWMTAAQIREVLALTDVGLVPVRSVPDAMPNKAFEFLAAGVPILSSVVGEMGRLLATADAGRSYPSGDADALARLVKELAGDPALRQRLARNAQELFRARFRASAIYASYAKHVERVAELREPFVRPPAHQHA